MQGARCRLSRGRHVSPLSMQAVQTQLRQAQADAELQRQELEAARQDLAALKNRGGSQNELAVLWQRLDAKGQEVSAVKNSHQQQLQVWVAATFREESGYTGPSNCLASLVWQASDEDSSCHGPTKPAEGANSGVGCHLCFVSAWSHKGTQRLSSRLATVCRGQKYSSASCSSSCLPLRGGHVSSSAVCSRSWTQPETTLKLLSSSLLR